MYLHTEAGDKHEKECGTCQSERARGSTPGMALSQPASQPATVLLLLLMMMMPLFALPVLCCVIVNQIKTFWLLEFGFEY